MKKLLIVLVIFITISGQPRKRCDKEFIRDPLEKGQDYLDNIIDFDNCYLFNLLSQLLEKQGLRGLKEKERPYAEMITALILKIAKDKSKLQEIRAIIRRTKPINTKLLKRIDNDLKKFRVLKKELSPALEAEVNEYLTTNDSNIDVYDLLNRLLEARGPHQGSSPYDSLIDEVLTKVVRKNELETIKNQASTDANRRLYDKIRNWDWLNKCRQLQSSPPPRRTRKRVELASDRLFAILKYLKDHNDSNEVKPKMKEANELLDDSINITSNAANLRKIIQQLEEQISETAGVATEETPLEKLLKRIKNIMREQVYESVASSDDDEEMIDMVVCPPELASQIREAFPNQIEDLVPVKPEKMSLPPNRI